MSYFEKILKEESPKLKTETIYLEPIDIPFSREEIEAEIERQEKLNPFIFVKKNNEEEIPVRPPVIFNPINQEEIDIKPESRNEKTNASGSRRNSSGRRSHLNESEVARRSVSITPLAKTQNSDQIKEKSLSSKELAVEVPIEKVKNIPIEVEKSFSISKNVKDFMAEKAIEAIRKSTITNSKYRMGCSVLTGDNKVITGLFFILFGVENIFSLIKIYF